uniref:E2F/DP family winged-helix DNA-binding domain-containing protein n=2 Tax=Spongospora subterranea TaxID=70186 RepID=A0A0H5QI49_9EUKA|eukprot:CRZ01668.1 hypothetical protein [Spongospora subterranea]
MGVPRRRLYDIINILENIGSTTRKGKASYYYNGPEQVHLTMSRLRDQPLPDNTSWSNMLFSECNDGERKTYTLGNLCKCFVSFLFNTPALSCTLDDFADTVFPLDESSPVEVFTAHKSCIRRLYDVVNVLIAFGVLEKVLRYRRNLFQIVIPLSNKNATGNYARESLTPEDVINEQPPLAEVTKISRLVFSTRLPSYQQDHKSAFQMLVDVAEHTPPPSLAIVKPSEIAMRHFDRIRSMGCLGDSNEFLARYQAVLQSWMVYQTTDRLFQ